MEKQSFPYGWKYSEATLKALRFKGQWPWEHTEGGVTRGPLCSRAASVVHHILENWKQFCQSNPLLSLFFCFSESFSIMPGKALKPDCQYLSVKSFDGGCCVEAHLPYKTAVSSPEPAAADLPLAWLLKASWRIYYYLWSGCTPLNSKAGSVVFFMLFLKFFWKVYHWAWVAIKKKIKILARGNYLIDTSLFSIKHFTCQSPVGCILSV